MGKLASKTTKRIMASLLTIAMIMSNMTVYASEYSEPAAQTEEAVENTETGAVELPSTNDETVQGDEAQDEGTQDGTADDKKSQEGTEGDAQDTDASDENSNPGNDEEGGAVSEPEMDGEEVQEPEATDADIQETELGAAEVSADVNTPTPRAKEHTLWLVGDSTVCSFNDKYYYPRYGYGTQIANYLDDTYEVKNLALSGDSSKDFRSEANYTTLLSGLTTGDVLVIDFGHNDEKAEEARYTNPNGDYQTEGSFAHSLYEYYVKKAIEAGASVILCTPIVRRNSSGTLSSANCHITDDATDKDGKVYPGGDYPAAIRKLVKNRSDAGEAVYLVDLTEKTKALYTSLGASGTLKLHAWTSSKEASVDNTHLNIYGAKKVAWLFANEVNNIEGLDLASHINLSAGEPTEAADLKSNPDYVETPYAPPGAEDISKLCKDYVIGEGDNAIHFKGTAFGDLGGNASSSNQILGTDSNGNMHIQVKNNKGKITATADGIAMYYYQVPVGKTFTLSAKATLIDIDSNDQVAFGLMARDDMYIDKYDASIGSDYVVAGSLGKGSNCYYRKDGKLGGQGALKNALQKGKDYDLSIVYSGDGVSCTFGDEETRSQGYDFQLTKVDSQYVYIGMFVARNADVTFSNIYLEVDGKPLADTRKQAYNITVTSDDNGTAEVNNAKASEGSTVVLSATPNDGYMFKEWQITSKGTTTETTTSVDNQYTMPANDVEIKAVFEEVITEWNFQTDSTLTGTNGIAREGEGQKTSFYVKGLRVDATKGKWDSTGDDGWAVVSKDTTITIPVKKSKYAKVEVFALTADYTVDYVNEANKANENEEFVCDASTGEILLEITGPDNTADESAEAVNKIRYIKVTPDYEYTPPAPKNNIQVWDFGGKEEENTDLYTNNIKPGLIRKLGIVAEGGSFKSEGPTSFGDLDMNYVGGDRFYSNIPALAAYNNGSYTPAQTTYSDGYASVGAWYGNGAGSAKQRTVTINNVKAGDKIVAYMGNHHNDGECEFTFMYGGDDADSTKKQTETGSVGTREFKKFVFIAKYDGSYNIYQSSGAGKIMYHRIMKMPVVTVSGTIDPDGNELPAAYDIRFYNEEYQSYTDAVVDTTNKTFTAKLTPGYTYRAILNASGLGFTTDTKNVEVKDTDCETTKIENKTLKVKPVSTYTYSGKIEGFADGYNTTDIKITMVPDISATDANNERLSITKGDNGELSFSATLEPDVAYTIKMEGVCDYEVATPEIVNNDGSEDYTNKTITVALKATYDVTGNFIGLGDSANVTKLTLTNIDDNYPYDVTVDGDGKGYSIKLRDGTYLASATVEGYSTKTHVVVNGKAVNRDIMFTSTVAKDKITYAEDIYVGYPDETNNYDTVSEAVEACALMNRTAAQRVTVHIAPGTYREQIIVEAPNVSFVNDTNKEVLLTWYYGIGYKYYSADSKGYYSPENAYDKFEKNKASKWGVAVYIKDTATAFRAEGITFENSFNRYITDEELDDGVELLKDPNASSISVVRNYKTDIESRTATERAAAIAIEADQAEFLNCGFYSSQDTLYTSGAHEYFKNCIIEGQTDYIFGSGNCVFDACELSWKGYSADFLGGYITANQSPQGEKGYLFRNCTVTGNSDLTVKPGYFGRPWAATAAAVFMNTKLQDADYITSVGWTEMGTPPNLPQNARFKEYNTTTVAGATVSTDGRITGTVIDAAAAAAITVADYFGTWKPFYYKEESATLEFATKPYVSDNGDANLPKPGHTLTVHYSLGDNDENDASIIQWYSVTDENDTGTLLKSSTALLDKTYQIEASTVGKYIKVTVTPQTISGNVGTLESSIMKVAVQSGYEDPSGGSDITLGDGINIFLAGDSTVKDYSENGMHEKVGENLGSWGEFIQTFFDESKVKIQNYANGGRSTRNFINEGALDEIKKNIGEGDYLFIQFGHNDCSNANPDRYVPVGTPDANGIYPITEGTLENGKYPDGGQGTFKWFLKQYLEVAKSKGATPVLVTPVARMYYENGTIKPHHDDKTSSNNAYVTAMKQLADEENVLLIDGFELTKRMFENAWTADGNNNNVYGNQVCGRKLENGVIIVDTTHNNKLGGLMEALLIAQAIQNNEAFNIAKYVKAPSGVLATTLEGGINDTVFTINNSSVLTAFDIESNYTERATYWETIGQAMINAIKEKAVELNPEKPENPNDGTVKFATKPHFTSEDAPEPGTVLEVSYTLAVDANAEDTSTVEWYRVEEGKDDTPLNANTDDKKKYTVVAKDVGKKIKVVVTPSIEGGKAGAPESVVSQEVTDSGNHDDSNITTDKDAGIEIKGLNASYPYTGAAVTPDFKVVDTGIKIDNEPKELTLGVDYTVKYKDNKKEGDATVTVVGKGNYAGKDITASFKIEAVTKVAEDKLVEDLKGAKIDKIDAQEYNGDAIYPNFTLTLKGQSAVEYEYDKEKEQYVKTSKAGTDAGTAEVNVAVSNNVNKGTATILVTGKKGSKGVKKTFKINPVDLSKAEANALSVTVASSVPYAVKGATPKVKVTYTFSGATAAENRVVELVNGKDYTVKYSSNKKAGVKGKVTITGKGNYTKKAPVQEFEITKLSMANTNLVAANLYEGLKAGKVKATVIDANKDMLKASQYTVEILANATDPQAMDKNTLLEAGKTVYVRATAKDTKNLEADTKTAPVPFTVGKNIAKAKFKLTATGKSKPYTGAEIKLEDSDLEVTMKGVTGNLRLKPANVTITDENKDDYDYEIVSYTNNINKGTATAVIQGIGDYSGTKTVKFKITAKTMKKQATTNP